MMVDALGADSPMSPEALAVAGSEVTLRLEVAHRVVDGRTPETDGGATEAMALHWLIQHSETL